MGAIENYIAQQPVRKQATLIELRRHLQKALPDSEERWSYQMPTYWQKRNVIHFAAFKNHLGIYPGSAAIEQFASELSGYKTSKGTIQIPWDQDVPYELITRIAQWNVTRNA